MFLILALVIAVASDFCVKVCSFLGKQIVKMQMEGNNWLESHRKTFAKQEISFYEIIY